MWKHKICLKCAVREFCHKMFFFAWKCVWIFFLFFIFRKTLSHILKVIGLISDAVFYKMGKVCFWGKEWCDVLDQNYFSLAFSNKSSKYENRHLALQSQLMNGVYQFFFLTRCRLQLSIINTILIQILVYIHNI